MLESFERLDRQLVQPLSLVVGGGAAMVLAYGHALATQDIDAFAARGGARLAELDGAARKIAKELDTPPDWLNSHFETFTGVLPPGYGERLRRVFEGERLVVDALGPEDLLVMKCFSGRDKDRPHARKLLRLAADLDLVGNHISALAGRGYPGADRAADYFDDLRDEADL